MAKSESVENDKRQVQASNSGAGGPGEAEAAAPPGAPSETCGADVAALTAERDSLLGRLQRVSADYLNYQKRVQREVEDARQYANQSLLKDLLPVLDDLELALRSGVINHGPQDAMVKGIQLVYDKAARILGRCGLEQIQAEGQPFDPMRHQAVTQEPSADVAAPTVVRELQKGYTLKGRVLRPAQVAVAMPMQESSEPAGEGEEQETE